MVMQSCCDSRAQGNTEPALLNRQQNGAEPGVLSCRARGDRLDRSGG